MVSKNSVTVGQPSARRTSGRRASGGPPVRQGHLDQKTQNHLGTIIKKSYDELLRQPVPEKLVELLEELARRESEK